MNDNCTFSFTNESVPQVWSVSPSFGGQDSTPVTIYGNSFTDNPALVTVTIGDQPCEIVTHNDTMIVCVPSLNEAGIQLVRVLVQGIGYSIEEILFRYSLIVSSLQPNKGTVGGGNIVTFSGVGFSNRRPNSQLTDDFYILFDEYPCLEITSNITHLTCLPQPHGSGTINVTVIVNGEEAQMPNGYLYSISLTAVINNIAPSSGPANGGTIVTISGENFINTTDITVSIGGANCNILSVTDTSINCLTTSNKPGDYDVIITSISSFGRAVHKLILEQVSTTLLSKNSTTLTLYTYVFQVSSITPIRGSLFGGTVLSIDGAGFAGNVSINDGEGHPLCIETVITYDQIQCRTKSTQRHHLIENNDTSESE